MPAKDISEAPADWLQALAVWLDEDDSGEDRFVRHIDAIYRMHAIEKREDGRMWHFPFEEVKAELIRRGLREPDPEPEFFSRSETVALIKERFGCKLYEARYLAGLLTCKWANDGRQWYRREDVRVLLAGD